MKVIFRIAKDIPIEDRKNYARNLVNTWKETPDMGCMVCFANDVEVYVVDGDAEPEVDDEERLNEMARLFRKPDKPKNGLDLWLDSNPGWYRDKEGIWIKNSEQEEDEIQEI